MIITEIELGNIPLKMLDADMLISPDQTAFKDAEKALNRVGMGFTADILFIAMSHHVMLLKFRPENPVLSRVIGHKVGIGVNMVFKIGFQGLGAHAGNVKGTDLAATLHQGKDSVFMPVSLALLCSGLSAYKGFIGLDRTLPAKHPSTEIIGPHGFPDSVGHKPGGLVGHAKHPMKLMRTYPLLAGGHKAKGVKPFVQFDMGILKDCAYGHSERLAATIALIKAGPMAFAFKFFDLLRFAAMRAYRAIRPAQFFKVLSGGGFIGENWVGEVYAHGSVPL